MSFPLKVPGNPGKKPKQMLKLAIPTSDKPSGGDISSLSISDTGREFDAAAAAPEIEAALAVSDDSTQIEGMSQLDWQFAARNGEIERLRDIGEGSGGAVRLCRLRGRDQVFALKEVPANPDTAVQRQILRELQVNRTCDSPYIVKYYGAYLLEEQGSIFIAMEYCEGGSLDVIARKVRACGARIGERVLAAIAFGVLSGISYLYDRGILHRDIKPQNILLNAKGEVKLCDFGVSGQVVNSLATTFTGTSYYMAPERIQGQPYSVTSDVWSLALTLIELAQARFPYEDKTDVLNGKERDVLTPIELLSRIVELPPPELSDEPALGITWSPAFRHFLKSCLAKDRAQRPNPKQVLSHPWIIGHQKRPVKMSKFVQDIIAET